jgi:hypothetical protein
MIFLLYWNLFSIRPRLFHARILVTGHAITIYTLIQSVGTPFSVVGSLYSLNLTA